MNKFFLIYPFLCMCLCVSNGDKVEPTEVELYVYQYVNMWYLMFLPGSSSDRRLYHTSIVIKNLEYSYNEDDGIKISEIGENTKLKFLRKETIGSTNLHVDEIKRIVNQLSKKFT